MGCGIAGVYNATEPEMAGKLLDRKWKNMEASFIGLKALGGKN